MPKGRGIMIEELFFRLDSTQQHTWCYLSYLVNSHQEFASDLEGFCDVLQSMRNHSISQGQLVLLDTKSARLGLCIVNIRLEADRNSSHLAFFYLLRERGGTFLWIQSSLVIGRQSKK